MEMLFLQHATGLAEDRFPESVMRTISRSDVPPTDDTGDSSGVKGVQQLLQCLELSESDEVDEGEDDKEGICMDEESETGSYELEPGYEGDEHAGESDTAKSHSWPFLSCNTC